MDWTGMIVVALGMYGILEGFKWLWAAFSEDKKTLDHMLADFRRCEREEYSRGPNYRPIVHCPTCDRDVKALSVCDGDGYLCPFCEKLVEVNS